MPRQRARRRTLFPETLPVRAAQILVDLSIFGCAFLLAYLLRFEGNVPLQAKKQLLVLMPYVAIARLISNAFFGVYRIMWRYVGLREALRIGRAVAAVSAILLIARFGYPGQHPYYQIPVGIIFLEGLLVTLGIIGSRVARRLLHERRQKHLPRKTPTKRAIPALLVGAGERGHYTAKQLMSHGELGLRVVGFCDDDPLKAGMDLHGLRVLGRLDDLPRLLAQTGARCVVITTSRIAPGRILSIVDRCRSLGVECKILPTLFDIFDKQPRVNNLREVRIEDLLSRSPIKPSLTIKQLATIYAGRRVVVTGAGGSIGSELCRQLQAIGVAELVLVERDENNMFEIERQLRGLASTTNVDTNVVPFLADIRDKKAISRLLKEMPPDAVFHAAAYKHVPMMERFPEEAIRNNVFGTRQLADLAIEHGVERFVMISTDKAVNPRSVMGASKRLAELCVQRAAVGSSTNFSCVRFGNVLGSRGSVVPIFRRQIEAGGPVTVTHPDAKRYFMTIPEAVNLVLQASTMGSCGDIFLLDMGDPVRILDLARQMILLSGSTESDVPIEFIGTRPGEKLFEELNTASETIEPTEVRKVGRCAPVDVDWDKVEGLLEQLDFLSRSQDRDGIRRALVDLDIGYTAEAGGLRA